jgi:adenylate kinase
LENQEQERYSSRILKEKYKLTHISTGDVFRFNLKNDTDLGKQARVYMDAGDLVPDELTTKMLIDEVNKHPDTNGILFDGYPRTLSQAIALDAFMISIDSKVTATIALEADDEILIQRLLERGKTSGRIDDQDDKIEIYQEYNEKTAPLMQYYNDQGKFMP